jgi:hypothetical protein
MFKQFFPSKSKNQPITRSELLKEFALTIPQNNGRIITFDEIGDKDSYNPSFILQNGEKYLAVRVESRESKWQSPTCYDPQVIFFKEGNKGVWKQVKGAPIYEMEDPFSAWVHDEHGESWLIVGGVEASAYGQPPEIATVFYKGKSIETLETEPFARVSGMKDIRLVELSDNRRKVICTRPRGGEAGVGTIGVVIVDKISDINQEIIDNAPLFHGQAAEDVKMGANELYSIHYTDREGNIVEYIGVIGHASFREDQSEFEHYYVISFCFDPTDPTKYPDWLRPKIIAKRENFDPSPFKEVRLVDVLFPGGIHDLGNNMVRLYTGVSDASVGYIDVPNPFAHCHLISK